MQRSNDSTVVGKLSAQVHAKTAAQQSFSVTVFGFRFKTTAFFYETTISSFMEPILLN
jgi:hypothetical protein